MTKDNDEIPTTCPRHGTPLVTKPAFQNEAGQFFMERRICPTITDNRSCDFVYKMGY